MTGDDSGLTCFDLPYFLTDKDGVRCSRARILLQGIVDHKSGSLRKAAALALFDLDEVSHLLENDQRLLSEAVLSALAVGLQFGASSPETARAILSGLQRDKANKRHEAPGGSRAKRAQIRAIWATGKYTAKDICAEQECAALGMSFSTARRALINEPNPT